MRVPAVIVILLLAAFFQNSPAFFVLGVKPDLVLAAFIAAAFYAPNFLNYLLMIFLPVVFLKSGFVWQWEPVIVAVSGMLAFYLTKRLPWHPLVNVLVCVTAATVLFYVFFDNLFLVGNWAILGLELAYNLIFAALFFYTFQVCLKTNSMLRT